MRSVGQKSRCLRVEGWIDQAGVERKVCMEAEVDIVMVRLLGMERVEM
jgi:hypothetical protein